MKFDGFFTLKRRNQRQALREEVNLQRTPGLSNENTQLLKVTNLTVCSRWEICVLQDSHAIRHLDIFAYVGTVTVRHKPASLAVWNTQNVFRGDLVSFASPGSQGF